MHEKFPSITMTNNMPKRHSFFLFFFFFWLLIGTFASITSLFQFTTPNVSIITTTSTNLHSFLVQLTFFLMLPHSASVTVSSSAVLFVLFFVLKFFLCSTKFFLLSHSSNFFLQKLSIFLRRFHQFVISWFQQLPVVPFNSFHFFCYH